MQEVFEKIIEKLEDKRKTAEQLIMENPQDELDRIQTQTAEDFASAYNDAIKIVKQEAEQYNNGWIPCSEQLPEDMQTCLVTARIYFTPDHVDEIDNYIGVGIDTYSKQFGWLGTETIAWQPLPAPYQPNGE